MKAFFRVLSWPMRHLMLRRAPTARHDGTPWTNDDRKFRIPSGCPLPAAALVQLRGDWEFFSQALRFPTAGSDLFCWKCNVARNGENSFHDFSPHAAHRATIFGHREYFESLAREGAEPPAIFLSPGFTVDLVAIDSMHTADLGVWQDVLGSVLWLEVSTKIFHRTNAAGLESLNTKLDSYNRANRHQHSSPIHELKMVQIRSDDPGYPTLRAKAAQTRGLAQFGLILAQLHEHGSADRPPFSFRATHRLHERSAEHRRLVRELLESVVAYQAACSEEPFQPAPCKAALYTALQRLQELHTMWRDGIADDRARHTPWHLRPKAHMLQHLAADQLEMWGSPARSWCYGDEDFAGCIKKVARASSHPKTLEQRVSEKCVILAGIEHYRLAHPRPQQG